MFIVIELQKTGDTVANIVQTYTNQNEADSRFYAIMSAAAISTVPVHSCMVIDEECRIYQTGTYKHNAQTEE